MEECLRILIRGRREIACNPSPSVAADNNTSDVSCPWQTVFVKHVRVTEQQWVGSTVD